MFLSASVGALARLQPSRCTGRAAGTPGTCRSPARPAAAWGARRSAAAVRADALATIEHHQTARKNLRHQGRAFWIALPVLWTPSLE